MFVFLGGVWILGVWLGWTDGCTQSEEGLHAGIGTGIKFTRNGLERRLGAGLLWLHAEEQKTINTTIMNTALALCHAGDGLEWYAEDGRSHPLGNDIRRRLHFLARPSQDGCP